MHANIIAITGASAGIGRAAAHAFARAGAATVVLLARDGARLAEACAEVERLGAKAMAIEVDVADAQAVEQAVERIETACGPIDVWVNNAMATIFAPLDCISPEEFARVTHVTYLGTVYATMSVLKRMRQRNRGTIVQVGSALAYRSIPLQSAYCGAKHAIRGFTDSVRTELLHDRSRVWITMVQLPGVNTPQFEWARTSFSHHPQPVGTVFEPEVAARAIVFAAGHRRREVAVGMPAAATILANKWMPGIMDRLMARRAYEQQFTPQPIAPDRPDNLFAPASSRYRTHGSFERRARDHSAQWWLSTHRGLLAVSVGMAGLAALLWRERRSWRGQR